MSSALMVRAPHERAPVDLRVDLARAEPSNGCDAIADLRRLFDRYRPLTTFYERRSMSPHPA